MIDAENLMKGLQVLTQYWDGNYQIEHRDREILFPQTDRPLSKEDLDKLIALEWMQDMEIDLFEAEDYDPDYWWSFSY